MAVAEAAKGDVVVIAGKGHERGQYVGDQVIPFDDREVAARALADRSRTERAAAALARADLAGGIQQHQGDLIRQEAEPDWPEASA